MQVHESQKRTNAVHSLIGAKLTRELLSKNTPKEAVFNPRIKEVLKIVIL